MVGRNYFGLSRSKLSGIPTVVPRMILGVHSMKNSLKI